MPRFTCRRCGVENVYRKTAQYYCFACSDIIQEEAEDRKRIQARLALEIRKNNWPREWERMRVVEH